jgi:hypothetical protein
VTVSEQRCDVAELRARRRYRPDMVGLACARVAEAREHARMSVPAFAAALGQLLGWSPDPDLIRAWESNVAPPGQVVIACEVLTSRSPECRTGPAAS